MAINKLKYEDWIMDALRTNKFKIEHDTIIYQWAKYEDPEQNIKVITQ